MALLEARDISMAYDDNTILTGCNATVEEGSSLAIVGASGTGKSTLLSVMGLLLDPTAGSVVFEGQNALQLSDDARSDLRNTSFRFIFQSTQLIATLTALENVMVPGLFCGRGYLKGKAERLLNEMGLTDRLHHYPNQLSIGQQRRVSIARALLLDPRIVFADEPTNDLDAENATMVGDLLYSLHDRGCALVLVTHDDQLAQRADARLRIANGAAIIER